MFVWTLCTLSLSLSLSHLLGLYYYTEWQGDLRLEDMYTKFIRFEFELWYDTECTFWFSYSSCAGWFFSFMTSQALGWLALSPLHLGKLKVSVLYTILFICVCYCRSTSVYLTCKCNSYCTSVLSSILHVSVIASSYGLLIVCRHCTYVGMSTYSEGSLWGWGGGWSFV